MKLHHPAVPGRANLPANGVHALAILQAILLSLFPCASLRLKSPRRGCSAALAALPGCVLLCLSLSAAVAFGQAKSAPNAAPAEASAQAAPATAAPASPEKQAKDAADADKVVLNLKQVGIDQVLKFISDLTGKPVMKHKDAKAQITIISTEKVSKQDAMRMLCEALRLEGTAVVQREKIIWLVPENMVSSLDVAVMLPESQIPLVGIVSKAIDVKFADVSEMERIIRPLLSKSASLIAHPGARKIIITDTIDRVENVEKVIAQLDALDVENRQVQIYPLQHADAEEIAPVLKAIMAPAPRAGATTSAPSPSSPSSPPPGGAPPGGSMPGGSAPGAPTAPSSSSRTTTATDVEIQAYKAANWLIVIAPKEKLPKISRLVAELDQQLTQEIKLRVIPVKYAAADELARQLGALVQKRYGKKVREVIEVASDQRSNSLVILSSEQNFTALQNIVKELDTAESVQTKTEWFELKYADAEDLAEQMNTLYQGLREDYPWYYGGFSRRSEAKTRFVCEKRSNALIAIAPPTEFDRIRETVQRLDKPIEADQVAPHVFPVRNNDAKELADVLNRVFGIEDTTRRGGYFDYFFSQTTKKTKVGRLYGQVRFDPLISSNAIIVTTNNKENFPIIEAFIRDMDESLPDSANLLLITLKNAQAADLARQLNGLFGREGTRLPGKGDQSQQGQQASQQSTQEDSTYSFLYGPQVKKEERPRSDLIGMVRVVPDIRTNSLMITTPAQNHAAIRELVERLDRPSPKVYVAVRLIEVSRTRSSNIGVRFSSTPSIFASSDFDNGVQTDLGFKWQEVYGNGVLSANVNINALVQFMIGRFDTRILSDTTLTMDNNRKGRIFVGSEIPFITNNVVYQGQVTNSFDYKKAGTELILTPIINADNRVVMDITMTVSQAVPGNIILGGQVLDTRNFETMLAVENSQTIVMGGILREQNVENIRRTPILGYIPVLDWIFAKKDRSAQVTELVAFITPSVLRLPADDAAVTDKAEEGIRRHHP